MNKKSIIAAALIVSGSFFAGCSRNQQGSTGSGTGTEVGSSGTVSHENMDHSSTQSSSASSSPDQTVDTTSVQISSPATASAGSDAATHSDMNASMRTDNNTSVTNQLHTAMQDMMDKMMKEPLTGDVDHDFAHLMIEHHRGGAAMARIELQSGDDDNSAKPASETGATCPPALRTGYQPGRH